jgi:predicted transcriptional regulator
MISRVVAILVVLLLPVAGASTYVDGGVAVVAVKDDRGMTCSPPTGPACAANVTFDPTNPGNGYVDVYQRVEYVGVATSPKYLPLPNENKTIHGKDLFVPNPVVPLVSETWTANHPNTSSVTNASLAMNRTEVALVYYGPFLLDPTGPSDWHNPGQEWAQSGEGFYYDQVGPFNTPTGTDTDQYWTQVLHACWYDLSEISACPSMVEQATAAYQGATPDVYFGAEWYDVQAASDPHDLTMGAPSASAHHDSESGHAWGKSHDPDNVPDSKAVPHEQPQQRGTNDSYTSRPRTNSTGPIVTIQQGRSPIGRPPPFISPSLLAKAIEATAATALVVLLFAAYSRFRDRRDLLHCKTRAKLIEIIEQYPGSNLSELARLTGVTTRTVRHHVSHLERWGSVRLVKKGNMTLAYSTSLDPASVAGQAPRRSSAVDVVLDALGPQGLTRRALSKATPGIASRTRRRIVAHLLGTHEVLEDLDPSGAKILRRKPSP